MQEAYRQEVITELDQSRSSLQRVTDTQLLELLDEYRVLI
jgi:hypothetical protein